MTTLTLVSSPAIAPAGIRVNETRAAAQAAQEEAAWEHIARACDAAIAELEPSHPGREELFEMRANCYFAAGKPRSFESS